jgi:hypothetical protein
LSAKNWVMIVLCGGGAFSWILFGVFALVWALAGSMLGSTTGGTLNHPRPSGLVLAVMVFALAALCIWPFVGIIRDKPRTWFPKSIAFSYGVNGATRGGWMAILLIVLAGWVVLITLLAQAF